MLNSCGTVKEAAMSGVAENYVKLVLAVGLHNEGYVDAYYGPEAWQDHAKKVRLSLAEIRAEANKLLQVLDEVDVSAEEELVVLRHRFLVRQIEAMTAYVDILGGETMSFDEESQALYDAVAPTHPTSYFENARNQLQAMLPGTGSLGERLDTFRAEFVIPPDRLDAVFKAAIEECRNRTLAHMELPETESFVVEYVTDKPWSGYNWYKGNAHSLIQVNTDLPIQVSRAIDLACHEGYPGHHVYNVLLEQRLLVERGWVEFCVYPLFSPMSLIAEGSANFGIEIAFPGDERIEFERDVLFPLAGLDPDKAEAYYQVEDVMKAFSYAGNEAARQYLNGELDRGQAEDWLVEYALLERPRAEQRVRFIDTYRSYVINYNLGQDLVRDYIEGTEDNPGERWKAFMRLLASPRLPSGLRP
jgi:hypothetical protein